MNDTMLQMILTAWVNIHRHMAAPLVVFVIPSPSDDPPNELPLAKELWK